MYSHDVLGVATSSFTCGSTGVCVGTTRVTQELFHELQRQINRVGAKFGITRLTVDGKLGQATLRSAVRLALELSNQLSTNLDRSLEELIIGMGDEGMAATTRDLALNADVLVAALKRDGVAEQPWSVLTTITETLTQIAANGAAAMNTPVPNNGQVINPYPATTVTPPAPTTPAQWADVVATSAPAPAMPPVATSAVPAIDWTPPGLPGWMFAAGLGVVAVVGGTVAAVVGRRRSAGTAGTRRRR